MSSKEKYRLCCSTCGGTNVLRDAYATWCEDKQDYELHSTYDDLFCEDCGREVHPEWIKLGDKEID